MKYYKDSQNKIYAYEADGSQDHLTAGKIEITKQEAEEIGRSNWKKEFDAEDYYRKRIYSYPEMGEFLDAWVKGDEAAMEAYRQKCLEVKARFPKPEGF